MVFGLISIPAMDQTCFTGNEKAIANAMNCTCYVHPLDPEMVRIKLTEAMKTKEKF